jgi:hypothetical protein
MHYEYGGTHDLIRVHDGLQTMGNRDDSHIVFELRAQRRLNDSIGIVVYKVQVSTTLSRMVNGILTDSGSRLVENKDFGLADDGPRKTNNLALADRNIAASA